MRLPRRLVLGGLAAGLVAASAEETIALWPGQPPGGAGPQGAERVSAKGAVTNVARPTLSVFRPAQPNGSAVLVVGGGGYVRIEMGSESLPAARWLQSLGFTAFALTYRLPGEGWSRDAPFADGQRALRLIRAGAAGYGVDPARIGALGFSAGAHLVGMVAERPAAPFYAAVDATDRVSARPDFCGLLYPVLTMMPPYDHTHAHREILGAHPSEMEDAAYSVERLVAPGAPPTFLAQAADDPIAPVENSLLMFDALRANDVVAELHVFATGGHGWGMGKPGTDTTAWPMLFKNWLKNG